MHVLQAHVNSNFKNQLLNSVCTFHNNFDPVAVLFFGGQRAEIKESSIEVGGGDGGGIGWPLL